MPSITEIWTVDELRKEAKIEFNVFLIIGG